MGRSEGDLGGVLDVGVSSEWVGRVEASETTCDLVEASLQERAMWRETGAERMHRRFVAPGGWGY